jgi:hypothetical protein
MRNHLIIDIRERSMFSLLMNGDGNVVPCTYNVLEGSSRYFFGEIFLEAQKYLEMNEKEKDSLKFFESFETNGYDITHLGKKFGWMWPYELEIDKTAIPIKHPLRVLSSAFISDSKEIITRILMSCHAILEFLLEPVFRYVRSRDFDLSEVNVVITIPNYYNRPARLLLYKLLRKRKFHRVILVSREIATMMSCLEMPSVDKAVILDMESDDSHFHSLEVNKSPQEVRFHHSDCLTLKDFGWKSLLKHLTQVLFNQNMIPGATTIYQSQVDKALMDLVYGIDSTLMSSISSLKITHGLFDKLFLKSGKKLLTDEYISRLRTWASQDYKVDEVNLIPLGLSLMVGHFEGLVFSSLKAHRLPQILLHRSLERTAYGMAAGLNWLRQGNDRKIKITGKAGLRVATGPGESIELVSHAMLPINPGEKRTIRQVLDFHLGEEVKKDILHFQLMWGINPNPGYNMNICLLSLNVTREDCKAGRKIWITLNLRRSRSKGGLIGSLTIRLRKQCETANFTIENDAFEIFSKDIV